MPPSPNSHARVGVTKYAASGSCGVWKIDHHRLTAVSVPIVTVSAAIRALGVRPLVSSTAPVSSSGQTR